MAYSQAKMAADQAFSTGRPSSIAGGRGADKYPARVVIDILRFLAYLINRTIWFVRYGGLENIPAGSSGGFIIAANHQTYVDPVWICPPISRHKFRFMVYDKALEWPLIGPFIKYVGAFPVSTRIGGTVEAIEESLRALEDGAVLTIFPEGEREFADGVMLPFKTGAVRIALRSGLPILPVTITGGNEIWPQKQKLPRLFRRVTVIYHPLFRVEDDPILTPHENVERLTAELRKIIANRTT